MSITNTQYKCSILIDSFYNIIIIFHWSLLCVIIIVCSNIYFSDLEQKQVPTILILYSFDCQAHEKVVSTFAGFLIEACHCNVHLDIFEEQLVYERGLDDWLVEKLQEADFIIVMCSVGARLRCTKKRVRFKSDPNRTIPDYFAIAVDYVAEKMRVERSKGLPMSRFIVTYMEYSSACDIPHQLDTGVKFNLMKDMNALFNHLHGFPSDVNKFGPVWRDMIGQNYDSSELTTELNLAFKSAKEYFKANPNWIEDSMEYVPPPSKSKSRHQRKSSLEPLLKESKMNLPYCDDSGLIDTTVDIHNQTLPRSLKQEDLNMVPLYQRQNSLPSSLSSHQTHSSPTPPTNTSKSFENFQTTTKYQNIDFQPCMFCGLEEHIDRRAPCKGRKLVHSQIEDTDQEDLDLSSGKMKSKSMPTMCPNLSSSSQTVLHAEVHKEWGFHDCHLSISSDSQESVSDIDIALDDLEKDVQSIRMLANYDTLKEPHTFPKALSVSVDLYGANPKSEIVDISSHSAALSLQPKTHFANESFHDSFSDTQDDQMIQLQDIKL